MRFAPLALSPALALVAICGTPACGIEQTDLGLRVMDGISGNAIAGATVSVDYRQRRTGPDGSAHFLLRANTYEVGIEHPAYLPLTTTIVIYPGSYALKSVRLYPRPAQPDVPTPPPAPGSSPVPPGPNPRPSVEPGRLIAIAGHVTDDKGTRIPNAFVQVAPQMGIAFGSATTNAQGEYRIEKVPAREPVFVTALAEGYHTQKRQVTPTADWKLDFTGAFGLRRIDAPAPNPAPIQASTVRLRGKVQDTMGRPLSGVMIKCESENVRFPFFEAAVALDGRYELQVPTELPLRFTASKEHFRTVSFAERVPGPGFGLLPDVSFTDTRALDPQPILEGE